MNYLNGVRDSFVDYCSASQQSTFAILKKLQELRTNPELFHKVCQVTFATLQLIMERYPSATYLSKLSFSLAACNMHYFYNVLKIPRQYFLPVQADSIDENMLLESLVEELVKHFKVDEEGWTEEEIESAHQDFTSISTLVIEEHLKEMRALNMGYCNADQFKEVLQKRIQNTEINENENGDLFFEIKTEEKPKIIKAPSLNEVWDLSEIEINDLTVTVIPATLTNKIVSVVWNIADVGCVALFLQGWGLLDTAKWSAKIGQIPGLGFVKNQRLDTWLSGICAGNYFLKFYESLRQLHDENLTAEQKRNTKWDAINSFAESVFNGAYCLNSKGYLKISNPTIQVLAIVAKGIGILNIATRPNHEYFKKPEPVEVAPAA